jgi:phospholipid-translocating ATPase
MVTGDKMENAEHVARSCKMIWPLTKPLYLRARDD